MRPLRLDRPGPRFRARAIRKAPESRPERVANRRAREALAADLAAELVDVMDEIRAELDIPLREAAFAGRLGTTPNSEGVAQLEARMGASIEQAFGDAIESGAVLGQRFLPSALAGAEVPTAAITEAADRWIRSEGARRIRRVTTQTRNGVRSIVAQALRDTTSPEAAAQNIGRLVGLTPRQAQAVNNFEAALVRRRIPDALADTQFVRESIAADVERYRDRLIADRGRAIAETEMQAAIQQGEKAFYDEAIASGEVEAEVLRKTWFTVRDDRVCPICEPLHGVEIPFNESFESRGFVGFGPPAHPRCRCYLNYSTEG